MGTENCENAERFLTKMGSMSNELNLEIETENSEI
jgi:hypothetical protein